MTDPKLGKAIDQRYQILCELGQDDSTITYKVKHLMMGRVVVLKILKEDHAAIPQDLERFKSEADQISGKGGTDEALVHDVGVTESGRPYFVTAITSDDRLDADTSKKVETSSSKSHMLVAAVCVCIVLLSGCAAFFFFRADVGRIELLRAEIALADSQTTSHNRRLYELVERLERIYEKEGRFDQAAAQCKRLMQISKGAAPIESLKLYPLSWRISRLYEKTGDWKDSEKYMLDAFLQANTAGQKLRGLNQLTAADPVWSDVVEMAKDKRTGNGGDYSNELGIQARNFLDEGRIDAAEAPSAEALVVGRRYLDSNSHQLVRIILIRVDVLTYKGAYSEAEKLALEARNMLASNFTDQRYEDCVVQTTLGALYAVENKDKLSKEALLEALRFNYRNDVIGDLSGRQSLFEKVGKLAESYKLEDTIKWVREQSGAIPEAESGR